MEIRDLQTYGEPGAVVYRADCVELMRLMPAGSVDAIFADPPYRLSGGGVSVKNGRLAPVDKGEWDRSLGSFEKDHEFNAKWLREARRVLKPGGTLWVSGTHHVIFSLGFALHSLGFKIIKDEKRRIIPAVILPGLLPTLHQNLPCVLTFGATRISVLKVPR